MKVSKVSLVVSIQKGSKKSSHLSTKYINKKQKTYHEFIEVTRVVTEYTDSLVI